jgi:hypothetical protein
MKDDEVFKPLLTLRLIWGALSFSQIVYGFVLFTAGESTYFAVPDSYKPFETVALLSCLLLFVTFNIHEKKIKPLSDVTKRFPLYVICWAFHECIVVFAFVAVLLSAQGNIFIYAINLLLALFGNLIMMPKLPELSRPTKS